MVNIRRPDPKYPAVTWRVRGEMKRQGRPFYVVAECAGMEPQKLYGRLRRHNWRWDEVNRMAMALNVSFERLARG